MKKDFNNNPAFEMLSGYTENENKNAESITATAPEATEKKEKTAKTKKPAVKTFEPIRKENKSKKLLLLLKPTLFDRLQAKAQEYEISTNELINQILENNV